MKHTWLFGILFFLTLFSINAQNNRQEQTERPNRPVEHQVGDRQNNRRSGAPGPGRNALIFNINARVLEEETIVWNQTESKNTIPGRAVGINLVGSNVIVVVQLTPFIRRENNILVAQGQIWIENPETGVSYYTSIQTIPFEFDEPIHFYPLGSSSHQNNPNPSIEIIITVNPYNINNTANEN